jgi:hypothetical protein
MIFYDKKTTKTNEKVIEAFNDIVSRGDSGFVEDTLIVCVLNPYTNIIEIFTDDYFSHQVSHKLEHAGFYYGGVLYNPSYKLNILQNIHAEQQTYNYKNFEKHGIKVVDAYKVLDNFSEKVFDFLSTKIFPSSMFTFTHTVEEVEMAKNSLLNNLVRNEDLKATMFKYGNIKNDENIIDLIKINAGDMSLEDWFGKKYLSTDEQYNKYKGVMAKYYKNVELYEIAKNSLTADEKVIVNLVKFCKENNIKDEANVTLNVAGNDDLLNYRGKNKHEGFSIEGKEVIIKHNLRNLIGRAKTEKGKVTFDIDYGATFTPKLKEQYSNRNEKYIDYLPLASINKITYGRKVIYSK